MRKDIMKENKEIENYIEEINMIQHLIATQIGEIKKLNFNLGCEEAKLAVFVNRKIEITKKLDLMFRTYY